MRETRLYESICRPSIQNMNMVAQLYFDSGGNMSALTASPSSHGLDFSLQTEKVVLPYGCGIFPGDLRRTGNVGSAGKSRNR